MIKNTTIDELKFWATLELEDECVGFVTENNIHELCKGNLDNAYDLGYDIADNHHAHYLQILSRKILKDLNINY